MKKSVGYSIYLDSTIKRIDKKVKQLGLDTKVKTNTFLNIRSLSTIILFIIVLISKYGYILAPILSIIYYILLEVIVFDIPIKKRAIKLEKEALFFLEILTLTLEGGRSLKHALDLAVVNVKSEIALEFKKTLEEVNLGKSLNEALNDMRKRIPSDAINNTILNMIEASTYGTNITNSINNQIEFLKNKQILDIKANISKLPTKISIISVLFFIPIMLLIILGPVLISNLFK